MKVENIIGLCVILLTFQSCLTFEKQLFNPKPLSESNLKELDGQYEIVEIEFDSVEKKYKKQIWMYNNFLTEIDRKLLKDTLKIDSLRKYKIDLKVLNRKKIRLQYFENDELLRERFLKVKLKKDGYLYLKNKNLGLLLLPYIAGAIDVKKTRLTKSKSGNLIFDVVNHRSGAFLGIVFLDGRTWRYRHEYKVIK